MGLDITAYEKVTLVRAMSVKEFNANEETQSLTDRDGHTLLYQDGLREQSDGFVDGVYATSGRTAEFCAGSYSGYNQWRNTLSTMMLGKSAEAVWSLSAIQRKGLPFVELIDFSDCDGFIGPKTAAKLAQDFAEHRAKIPVGADPRFVEKYNKWAEAFVLAAGNGAVKFH